MSDPEHKQVSEPRGAGFALTPFRFAMILFLLVAAVGAVASILAITTTPYRCRLVEGVWIEAHGEQMPDGRIHIPGSPSFYFRGDQCTRLKR